jgi:hypothetical protein
MSLQRLKDEMKKEYVDSDTGKLRKIAAGNVFKFVNDFIEKEQSAYKKNTESGLITFGKYKGQSVEQVAQLDKGLDYLGWISRQSWFSADKFPALYTKVTETLKADDSTDSSDDKKN